MGRPGRYTLSVMAWVAAYAGWSSIIGLVVAAITGDAAREVSAGWSALLTVIGPLVPTLVALWFNDWARDGFPTREQARARRRAMVNAAVTEAAAPAAVPAAPAASQVVADATVANATIANATIVAAHPLGVPARTATVPVAEGGFPVAPLVRD